MAHTKVTKTYSQNTGAANTFSYSGSFDVFKGTEVQVELDNVQLTFTASTINESASPREYTVDTSAKTVHIGGADLSSGTIIIRPVTDMGAPTPRATYAPGSSITSEDLNNNQLQLMRKAMEYDEQKLSSLGGTMTGHLTIGEDQTIIFEGATDDGYETTLTVADPTGSDKTITLPNVTGTVVTTGDTATVTATMLAANSVDSSELVDSSIDSSHISTGAVTTAKLGADVVTGAKIADDAIDSEHYTDGSIDTAHIADANITTAKLADNAVTTAKITDGNVTTAKIAADAITGAKIADNAIDSEHYVDASIDTIHLSIGAVDAGRLADNSVSSQHYVDGSIDTEHIGNNQVTGAKIAANSINSSELVDGSVDTDHIADLNVTTAKIAADAITGAKIADDAIDSEHYAAGSIDTEHIGGTQVTAAKIASNAVTTAKITDANVTTAKIADSNVTLAKLASDLKQTSISDSDTQLPTSGAVVDYVAAQIAPIGGLEVIATDAAFPNTQPSSGVVISIADAGGLVVNGSGTSTTGRTIGGSTVTINNIASNFNSSTVDAGVCFQVSSTGSGQIYNYHKATLKEADLLSLSNDINDFAARYRVQSGEPGSNNDAGDLVFDTAASKMKVYDGSSWGEVTSSGDFKYLVMTNAGTTNAATLNGSNVTFDLKETSTGGSAASVTSAAQLMVSVNGVVQKPNTGTNPSGLDGFVMADSDTITFCAAPASGDDIFIIQTGSAITPTTPADGTVTAAKIGSGAVTTAKIADDAVTGAKVADNLDIPDNNKIRFGTGNDLEIYHDGSNSYLSHNGAGDLFIDADGSQETINLRSKKNVNIYVEDKTELAIKCNESGAVELYYDNSKKLETTTRGILVSNTEDQDTVLEIKAGNEGNAAILKMTADQEDNATDRFRLYVPDSDGISIQGWNGSDWETYLKGEGDNVELYYDNSKKLNTDASGISVTGRVYASGASDYGFLVDDNVKIGIGTGKDLQIYHDGDDSIIKHDGTGTLYISTGSSAEPLYLSGGQNLYIRTGGNESAVTCVKDGAVELYYDNVKKFETTGAGSKAYDTFQVSTNASTHEPVQINDTNNTNSHTHRISFKTNGTEVGRITSDRDDTLYVGSSDYRLKENQVNISDGITRLKTLKPYRFNFKSTPSKTIDGFFAHEAQEVVPYAVTGEKDGERMQGIDYGKFTPLLTAALQEAIAKIETLETEVAALKAK